MAEIKDLTNTELKSSINDELRLTTTDNPFNPFTDFSRWFMFDASNGYNTCGKLDRLTNITDDMTEKEIEEQRNKAIDFLLDNDMFKMYRVVTKNDPSLAQPDS